MVDSWDARPDPVRRIWPRSFEPSSPPQPRSFYEPPSSASPSGESEPEVVDTVRGWLDRDDAGELLGDFVGRQVESVLDRDEFHDVDPLGLCDRPDHLFCELLGDMANKVHQVAALAGPAGEPVGDIAYPPPADRHDPLEWRIKRAAVDLVVHKLTTLTGAGELDVVATVLDVAAAGCCPHLDDHRGLDASSSALLTREFVSTVVPRALDGITDEDSETDGNGDRDGDHRAVG